MHIKRLTIGSCATNCYFIIENDKAVVVDPTDAPQHVLAYAKLNNIEITHILVTHGHFDHVGGVREIIDFTGAKAYISEIDYNDLSVLNDYFGYSVQPFKVECFVDDGSELNLSGHTFKTLSTAGHTAGGVCYIMDDNTIFTGDTLFRSSVGRVDFPRGCAQQLKHSLKKLFDLDGNYTVLPGHGLPTELDHERKHNPYADI